MLEASLSGRMMFCLTGNGPRLSCDLFPPLDLGEKYTYVVGLVDLCTYNSIPNIETGVNDKIYIGDKEITLDEGAYEIEAIESAIFSKLNEHDIDSNNLPTVSFSLKANNSTLKVELVCSETVDFTKSNTLASLLGFESKVLPPGKTHVSSSPVNIIKVENIRVVCNIVRGSWDNGSESHVIHEFYPTVAPGYKIVECPSTIIYLPVNTRKINTITVELKDQDGRLVNLRNESLSVRLHIKREHGFGI